MKRLLSFFVVFAVISLDSSGQQYPDIPLERLLPASQQEEMGLRKLTENERDEIRVFIIDMYLRGVEEGRKEGSASFSACADRREPY